MSKRNAKLTISRAISSLNKEWTVVGPWVTWGQVTDDFADKGFDEE